MHLARCSASAVRQGPKRHKPPSSAVAKPLRADHPASASITAPGAIAARQAIVGDQRAIAARKAR